MELPTRRLHAHGNLRVSDYCYEQVKYPRYQGENLAKNKVLYDRVALLGKKHNCTPGQMALAWLLHQGDDVVPIPGIAQIMLISDCSTSIYSLHESCCYHWRSRSICK